MALFNCKGSFFMNPIMQICLMVDSDEHKHGKAIKMAPNPQHPSRLSV